MFVRPIKKEDYSLVLELDKKVYPTDSPVTKRNITNWYLNNPEFGLIYEEDGSTVGLCIAIPLNANGWKRLTEGTLAESDLDERVIFDNSKDEELDIHIYHIERFDGSMKCFYKTVLRDLSNLIENLKERNKALKVIGFSGLCVTKEGIDLFESKLGCKEHGYVDQEHILEKNGKRMVLKTDSQAVLDSKIKDGYSYLNRCKMLTVYHSENSVVWSYFRASEEMVGA